MTKLPIFMLLLVLGVSSPADAQNFACLDCHDITGADGVNDFSMIYAHTKPHHPAGIAYPASQGFKDDFKAPNGQSAGIAFFDRNGNGQPDGNEVQLYIVNGRATIECATCHIEHGTTPRPAGAPPDVHLRVENTSSALCSTCHIQ